jgi:Ca2+-binding RTX toxin-like protein
MGNPRSAWRRVGAVSILAVALLLLAPVDGARASGSAKYYDGVIRYSTVVNCPSMIFGTPYTEYGVGAYTGYYANPDAGEPRVASQYTYLHVVVSGLGNPCSGGTYFWPQLALPAGVTWYKNQPIECRYNGNPLPPAECPQWSNLQEGHGLNGSDRYMLNTANAGQTWGVAQGRTFEFIFPIWAPSNAVSGSNATVYLQTADGNSSPTLNLTAPLYFFGAGAQPGVLYDTPSTRTTELYPGTGAPTKYGILSQASVLTHRQSGWLFMDVGTSPGNYEYGRGYAPQQTTSAHDNYTVFTDWEESNVPPLVPGRRYYWRAGFDPGAQGGSDLVFGAQQSFVAPTGTTCRGKRVTVNLSLGELPTEQADVVLGTNGADRVHGAGGDDTICGGGGADILDGGPGADLVDGGKGNDTLVAIAGNDTVIGGAGTDVVSYAGNEQRVRVSLASTTAQDTVGAGTDTITGVENLVGGDGNDTLIGSAGDNTITGGPGDDTIKGGAGVDTVNFGGATSRITVNLALTTVQVTGQGSDRITGVENAVGGKKADHITGNAGANRLTGGAGDDKLFGGAGPDHLVGGRGRDRCDGGPGTDTAASCEIVVSVP